MPEVQRAIHASDGLRPHRFNGTGLRKEHSEPFSIQGGLPFRLPRGAHPPASTPPPGSRPSERATSPTSSCLLVSLLVLASLGLVLGARITIAGPTLATTLGNNGVSPPPTVSASAVYDAADGYVVMFGGEGVERTTMATTWIFTRGNWSELTPVGGQAPPARFQAQMAYDAADHEVLLFGGCADVACSRDLSDTWTFGRGQWTNVTALSAAAPAPRDRAGMVFDAADGYVLLTGGEISNGMAFLSDTWVYRNTTWTQLPPPTGPAPSARAGAAVVYDGAIGKVVLFGGHPQGIVAGDTWTYAAGNWTNLSSTPPPTPLARWAGSSTFDSEDGYVLLVNGYNQGQYFQDVWALRGTNWTLLPEGSGPYGSYGSVLVDDPGDGYVLFFSGALTGGYFFTSTFLFLHGGWVLLVNPPAVNPPNLFEFLLPVFFLPVMFGVALPLGNYLRTRREKQLGAGVVVAPGEMVQWIDTPHPWRRGAANIVASAIVLIIPATFLVPIVTLALTPTGIAIVAIVVGVGYGSVIAAIVLSVGRVQPRALGIVPGGVIVRRAKNELRVGWEFLQPSLIRPRNDRYWFQFLYPGREGARGGIPVTFAQARAILTHPSAPGWVLARPVADALGLPARPSPVPPSASPIGAQIPTSPPLPTRGATTPYYGGAATGGAPSPATVVTYPPPPPPGYYYPPPPYAPAPPPPPPPPSPHHAPPTGPSGATACPRCGQLNATGLFAFCRTCGHRIL